MRFYNNFLFSLLIYIFILFHGKCLSYELNQAFAESFYKSFINCYDFSTLGKYAHEYHPALLSFTRNSLQVMESRLEKLTDQTSDRIVIMGYEQHALPNFFPCLDDFKGGEINDEFSEKLFADWSKKIHNHFGVLSAFLFRSQMHNSHNEVFVPVASDDFGQIFEPCMRLFHLYSFGSYLNIMLSFEKNLMPFLENQDAKTVLKGLIDFWREVYSFPSQESKTNMIITQDILFNIENATHLVSNNHKIKKFFFGPDLTYPIETKEICKKKATRNAQIFLQKFIQELKPLDNLPTVYIFKSFVDGVGKSTLLGNIKNYLNFGLDFDSFKYVDNSSSVEFDFFEFAPSVFIADLPAQMSHFTFKPDGMVYVHIDAVKLAQTEINLIQNYFESNQDVLSQEFKSKVQTIQKLIDANDWFNNEIYSEEHPENLWIKNIISLKKLPINDWLPFQFNNQHFLGRVNEMGMLDFKILTPIGEARSEGLKNADPAQMLFFKGLTVPACYDIFLNSLEKELSERNISRIVYVDFFSMYSRSSRENVRLNYILQHIAMHNPQFNLSNTLYDSFLCDTHLLSVLSDQKNSNAFVENINLETMLRLWLHHFLQNNFTDKINFIHDKEIFLHAQNFLKESSLPKDENLKQVVKAKIKQETDLLKSRYGYTKDFWNLYKLDFGKLFQISEVLENFFCSEIDCPILKSYFEVFPSSIDSSKFYTQKYNQKNRLCFDYQDNTYTIHRTIKINSKNKILLKSFISKLRVNWYQLILNLTQALEDSTNKIKLDKLLFKKDFLVLRQDQQGYAYIISKQTKSQNSSINNSSTESPLTNLKNIYTTKCRNQSFSWQGLHGFCIVNDIETNDEYNNWDSLEGEISNLFLDFLKSQPNQNEVVSIKQLHKMVSGSFLVKQLHRYYKKIAFSNKKNKCCKPQSNFYYDECCDVEKHFFSQQSYLPIFKMIQLLIVLEIFVRDLDSQIIVKPNQEDIVAATKYFADFVIPEYCNQMFEVPLYKIYTPQLFVPDWLDNT